MATNCYACGYRDNEIKSGGAISAKGKRITLKVEDEEDLARDLLKVGPHARIPMMCSLTPLASRSQRSTLFCNPVLSAVDSLPSKAC